MKPPPRFGGSDQTLCLKCVLQVVRFGQASRNSFDATDTHGTFALMPVTSGMPRSVPLSFASPPRNGTVLTKVLAATAVLADCTKILGGLHDQAFRKDRHNHVTEEPDTL